jgi:NAD(P)-dependent dehydrogenase (short-subunit alcohol dehydrogenase family)
MELTPWGIHVVLVAPAGIATPAVNRLLEDGDAAIARFSPAGLQHYERSFRAFLATSVARERKGSSPDVVAGRCSRRSRPARPHALPVGADATALTWLPRLLPARRLDRLRFHLFGLPGSFAGEADSAPRDLD